MVLEEFWMRYLRGGNYLHCYLLICFLYSIFASQDDVRVLRRKQYSDDDYELVTPFRRVNVAGKF